MNLMKRLEKPGHLEKATEERLQKQVALHIRQAGDIGRTAGGQTETRLLGGGKRLKFLVA